MAGVTTVVVAPKPIEQPVEKVEKLKLRTVMIDDRDFSQFAQSLEGERLFIETITGHKPLIGGLR
jgi:hypothetical protein